jgi:Mrp family chromosome partitioning ATPase/capsular polysaccharide biosynthesis protein
MIVLVVLAVTAGSYFYYDSKPKVYSASTELLIRPTESDPGFNSGTPDRVGQNLIRILQSSGVVEEVQRRSGVAGSVSATLSQTSDFIVVTARAGSAGGAARLANAYADALVISRRRGLQKETDQSLRAAEKELAELPPGPENADQRQTLKATIESLKAASVLPPTGAERIDRAIPPGAPVEPNPRKNAQFAFFLSLLLSLAAAFALDRLDRRIRTLDEVERAYGFPVLAAIPHTDRMGSDAGSLVRNPSFQEAFRTLQTNLHFSNLDRPPRTILVTSALPGEGKSTFVHHLALAFRDSGMRVAIVESDLRRPALAALLRVKPAPGLTNVLAGRAELADTIQHIKDDGRSAEVAAHATSGNGAANGASSPIQPGSIAVLTGGPAPANPPAVLATERFRSVFDEISSQYDVTLIDSAPLLAVSDSVPLLSRVDGTILISRIGRATHDSATKVSTLLDRNPHAAPVLGVVANDVPLKGVESSAYGYYSRET